MFPTLQVNGYNLSIDFSTQPPTVYVETPYDLQSGGDVPVTVVLNEATIHGSLSAGADSASLQGHDREGNRA